MSDTPRTAEDLYSDPEDRKPDGTEAFLDQPVNASNAKQLKAKALTDTAHRLKEENDLREVLSTPAGVRFVARVVMACGWNAPYFMANNSLMCEVAGRRSIAFQIEQWASDVDLNLWLVVRQELEQHRVKPKTSERTRS